MIQRGQYHTLMISPECHILEMIAKLSHCSVQLHGLMMGQ